MNKIVSKIAGKLFSIKFSTFFQKRINEIFVRFFNINLSEYKNSSEYSSLQDLFTRSLEKTRRFSELKTDVIAPTDSKIIELGCLRLKNIFQVKGVTYSVRDLLSDGISRDNIQKINNGSFINFYLSLKDYHHFHAPADILIQKIVHIPGNLYPVKESFIRKKEVFSKNERIVLECKLKNDKLLYFILIGALNVGNIKIYKEPRVITNSPTKRVAFYMHKKPLFIKKGDDIGHFSFGSSVVIISEKNALEYNSNLLNKNIKFGDTIGNLF